MYFCLIFAFEDKVFYFIDIMEKKEAQDLTKTLNNLVSVLKDLNKYLDKQNQALHDNTEATKDLRTRLASVANAISNGTVVNSD